MGLSSPDNDLEYIESETDGELKAWLKINFEPWDSIKSAWVKTCEVRRNDILNKSFDDLLAEWPRYSKKLAYELVNIDFEFLHPSSSHNLKYLWHKHVKQIIELALNEATSKNDKDGIAKFGGDIIVDEDENFMGMLALNAVFYLCPNRSKTTKQTFSSMFKRSTRGARIDEEVMTLSIEAAKKKKKEMNPFILYFEDESHIPYKFFVCVNHIIYEISNFVTALDTLFKCYFVFDLSYPKECVNALTFIQHFFFQIFLEKDLNSTVIKSFMCDLNIDRAIACENMSNQI